LPTGGDRQVDYYAAAAWSERGGTALWFIEGDDNDNDDDKAMMTEDSSSSPLFFFMWMHLALEKIHRRAKRPPMGYRSHGVLLHPALVVAMPVFGGRGSYLWKDKRPVPSILSRVARSFFPSGLDGI
jgi:hypothetical protein